MVIINTIYPESLFNTNNNKKRLDTRFIHPIYRVFGMYASRPLSITILMNTAVITTHQNSVCAAMCVYFGGWLVVLFFFFFRIFLLFSVSHFSLIFFMLAAACFLFYGFQVTSSASPQTFEPKNEKKAKTRNTKHSRKHSAWRRSALSLCVSLCTLGKLACALT